MPTAGRTETTEASGLLPGALWAVIIRRFSTLWIAPPHITNWDLPGRYTWLTATFLREVLIARTHPRHPTAPVWIFLEPDAASPKVRCRSARRSVLSLIIPRNALSTKDTPST